MTDSGAIVWWIDKSHKLRSEVISPARLKRGHSYESEASWITDNAVDYEVILLNRAGMPEEKQRLERLRLKAEDLRVSSITGDNAL